MRKRAQTPILWQGLPSGAWLRGGEPVLRRTRVFCTATTVNGRPKFGQFAMPTSMRQTARVMLMYIWAERGPRV